LSRVSDSCCIHVDAVLGPPAVDELLRAKLLEEARELAEADAPADVRHEAADVLYFTLVALARAGVPLDEVERELDRRARKVSRRPGDAKQHRDE
jgi:phosphoribosyl-ATP pyrophosphohydrolase